MTASAGKNRPKRRGANIGMALFFMITGLANFVAGFGLAMCLGIGPNSLGDVLAVLLGRPLKSDEFRH